METFGAKTVVLLLAVILGGMFIIGVGNPQREFQGALGKKHYNATSQMTASQVIPTGSKIK